MKKYWVLAISVAILNVCLVNNVSAKSSAWMMQQDTTQAPEFLLDKAVNAQEVGNTEASLKSLEAGTAALEKEASESKSSFKDKILSQVGVLNKFALMLKSGLLKGDVLKKGVNTVKMLLAAKRVESHWVVQVY